VKVVVDTNVIVSGLGFGGRPFDVLLRTFDQDKQLLASEQTLQELERVMSYEHLPFTTTEQIQYPRILRLEATIVAPSTTIETVRDSDDDKFLECAVAGDADCIVSGDEDLLELESYQGIQIITPALFLERYI